MDQPGVQQIFFQHIKNSLPPHLSLVDEIAELLNISNDSAYRRIRGEKGISFEEVRTLCSHFKISLDQFFQVNSDSVIFTGRSISPSHNFDVYLKTILSQFQFLNSFDKRDLYYVNKDIPIFHYFNFHKLAAFKFFFWMKTLLQYPLYAKNLFVADEFMESLQNTAGKIVDEYNKIPSQEIWNIENINATISQIEYYRNTKVFASEQDVADLYNELEMAINHIERQAELGYKFPNDGKYTNPKASYKLFVNEFILGDNTSLAILNEIKVVYVNHSVLNIMWTRDTIFTDSIFQHIQNIIRKSTLISDVGEKDRSLFFGSMRERIYEKRKLHKV